MSSGSTDKVFSGIKSTRMPDITLIPYEALEVLARRMEYGIQTKGDGAWNASKTNYREIVTRELVLDRLGHVIKHAFSAIERIRNGGVPMDDCGAILFGGALLACYDDDLIYPRIRVDPTMAPTEVRIGNVHLTNIAESMLQDSQKLDQEVTDLLEETKHYREEHGF